MPFERPLLDALVSRVELELRTRLAVGPFLRRSPGQVISRVLAGQSHELHGHLDFNADQVLPTTGDSETLERWAALFSINRKPPGASQGSVTFTGVDASTVPAGTVVQRALDSRRYSTDIVGTIAAGVLDVAVTAVLAGLDGDAATGTILSLVSPVSGVNTDSTVVTPGLTGGVDLESDADLLTRLLVRIQTPPQGGSVADFKIWGLLTAEVTRVFPLASHFGLGTVGVTFTVDNDPTSPIPDAAKVAEVQVVIDALRPVTAQTTVFAPGVQNLSPFITLTPNTATVQAAVTDSLDDLLLRDAEPGGTLLLSRINEAISNAAGELDHVLTSPIVDVTTPAGTLLLLGTPTFA